MLKLDFEKAYDMVCWGFLHKMLERKGSKLGSVLG